MKITSFATPGNVDPQRVPAALSPFALTQTARRLPPNKPPNRRPKNDGHDNRQRQPFAVHRPAHRKIRFPHHGLHRGITKYPEVGLRDCPPHRPQARRIGQRHPKAHRHQRTHKHNQRSNVRTHLKTRTLSPPAKLPSLHPLVLHIGSHLSHGVLSRDSLCLGRCRRRSHICGFAVPPCPVRDLALWLGQQ